MTHSTAVPRLALWKVALGLGAVVAAFLAITSAASAAIITVTPDNSSGTDNLTAAINTANTNTDASNTIVLTQAAGAGRYVPVSPITISKNLTITGAHAVQAVAGANAYAIDGSSQASVHAGNLFTINSGVTLTLEGVGIVSGGGTGFYQIADNGNLVTWGAGLTGAPGGGINVGGANAAATATLNETSQIGDTQDNIDMSGASLTLNNSDILQGASAGVVQLSASSAVTLNNSVLVAQTGNECTGVTAAANSTTDGSLIDDTSCPVQHQGDLSVTPSVAPGANGGPTLSSTFGTTGSTIGTGNPALCPVVDQRFFVNPVSGGVRSCDIGATTNAATQETATQAGTTPSTGALTCKVTALRAGPPAQQDVTLADTLSGIGPEAGAATDPQSGTPATPGDNTPVGPPFGTSPGDSVTNLFISNGTVAFTAPQAPSNTGVVLTATKATAGVRTSWNFTATNWAGNSKACN
jgi:hypothetical protein